MPGNKGDRLYPRILRSKRKNTKLLRENAVGLPVSGSMQENNSVNASADKSYIFNLQTKDYHQVYSIKCIVPGCGSDSLTSPSMAFIHVPFDNDLRKKWLKAIGILKQFNLQKAHGRPQFCCQKHFDLRHDSLNYDKWFSGEEELKLYKDVLPRLNIKPKEQEILASHDWPCFVPSCSSSVQKCPGKLFIKVPAIKEMRAKWFSAVGRNNINPGNCYCCVDHFDMNVDICRKDKTFLIKCDTIPHRNINRKPSVQESDNRNTSTDNKINIKLESDNMDLDEPIMSLKELKDISASEVVWVSNPTNSNNEDNLLVDLLNEKDIYNQDMNSKEMYLLSLLPDLQEMSDSQIETFKTKIYDMIRTVKAKK